MQAMDKMVAIFCCVDVTAVTYSAKKHSKGQEAAAAPVQHKPGKQNSSPVSSSNIPTTGSSGVNITASSSSSSSSSASSSDAQIGQRGSHEVSSASTGVLLAVSSVKTLQVSSSSRTTTSTFPSATNSSSSCSSNSSAADSHIQVAAVHVAPVTDKVSPLHPDATLEVSSDACNQCFSLVNAL
jgi:hypothetical protein